MTISVLDGNGVLQTGINTLNDYMAANPVGAQPTTAARTMVPATTTDSARAKIVSANGVNNTLVSATARIMRTLDIYNRAAYPVYFKLYDKATAPVAGTDVPFWTIPLAADSGYSKEFPWGLPVTLGLGYAITKLFVDTDTTAVVIEDVAGQMTYR